MNLANSFFIEPIFLNLNPETLNFELKNYSMLKKNIQYHSNLKLNHLHAQKLYSGKRI